MKTNFVASALTLTMFSVGTQAIAQQQDDSSGPPGLSLSQTAKQEQQAAQAAATPDNAQPATQPVVMQDGVKMCPCPPTLKHVLGEHAFLPSFTIPAPFADSQATVALGFAYGTFDTSGITGIPRQLKLGAFEPHVWGQIKVMDRLAVNFGIRGNVVVGMNSFSAINYGASTTYALALGALYELVREESDVLTFSLQVERPHTLAVSPINLLDATFDLVIDRGDPDFVTEGISTRWMPQLRYAHAFNPIVGMLAFIGGRVDDKVINDNESKLKVLLPFGVGLSTDFKPWIGVPVGLTANYRRSQVISAENGANSNTVSFGLFETFAPEFNFGLELGFIKSNDHTTTAGSLTAKVYYN